MSFILNTWMPIVSIFGLVISSISIVIGIYKMGFYKKYESEVNKDYAIKKRNEAIWSLMIGVIMLVFSILFLSFR